jgi:mono/diheme cytochrome c family protein
VIVKALVVSAGLGLAVAGSLAAQRPVSAATLFARNCASCHGPRGAPMPSMVQSMGVADFSKPATLAAVPDSVLRATVTNGKGKLMQGFGGRLTPEQIEALVRYVRTLSRH